VQSLDAEAGAILISKNNNSTRVKKLLLRKMLGKIN
jgi:hypothetical protein